MRILGTTFQLYVWMGAPHELWGANFELAIIDVIIAGSGKECAGGFVLEVPPSILRVCSHIDASPRGGFLGHQSQTADDPR